LEARERFVQALSSGTVKVEPVEMCPCGGTDLVQLANKDRFGLDFGAFLCRKCGLVLTSPMISEDSLATYYADYYHDLHFPAAYSEQECLFQKGQGNKIFELLKQFIGGGKPLRLLDVGAGTGSTALEFRECASQAGLEISLVLLEYNAKIRERLQEGEDLEVIVGGLPDLKGCGPAYDIVIMSHVLEHFRNIGAQLRYLKPHVDDKSLIYVEIPGLFRLKHSCEYNCDFLRYFTSAHLYHFNFTSLCHVMSLAGFRSIWGNEIVESVFQTGSTTVDVSGNATEVENYLRDLESSLGLYQHLCDLQRRMEQLEARATTLELHEGARTRSFPLQLLQMGFESIQRLVGKGKG